jgi:phosphatidylserine decarboxylase
VVNYLDPIIAREGGPFLAATVAAALEIERNALWRKTATGADVTCVQNAGLIARRILCYVKSGDRPARGARFGLTRFGLRVDVYLPVSPRARVKATLGDSVQGGGSLLAVL